MDSLVASDPQRLWLMLVAVNFAVQILGFYRDESRRLYLSKKITTPMLLLGGLIVVVLESGSFPLVTGTILLAMGIGELGIEGSQVVEYRESDDLVPAGTPWTVTAAGVLFLLVNLFIGIVLLRRADGLQSVLVGTISGVVVTLMALAVIGWGRPDAETRTQLLAYSAGLAVLAAGAFTSLATGLEPLGRAALVLTVSDSLVLIRMGASWDKRSPAGFRVLLGFLVTILLLYYAYIWLLIRG